MNKPSIAIFACAFAFGAMPARGDDGEAPPPSKSPAQQAPEATRPGNTRAGQETPKDKAKHTRELPMKGEVVLSTSCDSASKRAILLKANKNWDEMNREEQYVVQRAWLCATGDFGTPGRGGVRPSPANKSK